jgi:hypothetical protein
MSARKQRVEAVPPQVKASSLLTLTDAPLEQQPGVIEVKPGTVTAVDRVKGYYHTVFAVLSGLALCIVELGPDVGALPGLSPDWRHGIAVAVIVANIVATKVKSNEQWFPAPPAATPPAA